MGILCSFFGVFFLFDFSLSFVFYPPFSYSISAENIDSHLIRTFYQSKDELMNFEGGDVGDQPRGVEEWSSFSLLISHLSSFLIPLFFRYFRIPTITRMYLTICVLVSIAVQLDILSPFGMARPRGMDWQECLSFLPPSLPLLCFSYTKDIFLEFHAVIKNYEFHRLFTTFFFFGSIDVNFIFHLYFLYRHSRY